MSFKEYLHVENLSNVEVEGILDGKCYVFPKLDGTNGSIWMDNDVVKAGSRKRELTLIKDNAGFCNWVLHSGAVEDFFKKYGHRYRLFGEWLIPNQLRTYCDEAWRQFYVFDVYDRIELKYLSYTDYTKLELSEFNIIPCIQTTHQPTAEYLRTIVNHNDYLIQPGMGNGEGIVIKNYKYINKYGRYVYAKVVREGCKQRQGKTKKKNRLDKSKIEQLIVDKYVTGVLCNKEHAKLVNEIGGWTGKTIPRLLDTTFHSLVVEEIWDILKKFKSPTINFRQLKKMCDQKVKELKPEIFF